MNLSQLNYFKKLAEVLHYTRAAQELFITQPTLSGAISSLEKELGAPLFERNRRSVLLTPYGEVFYEHVCLALRAIDDEEINLYMMNPKSPCFIKDDEENYIYLILPVNFNAASV